VYLNEEGIRFLKQQLDTPLHEGDSAQIISALCSYFFTSLLMDYVAALHQVGKLERPHPMTPTRANYLFNFCTAD
jgi:hypothetical protein